MTFTIHLKYCKYKIFISIIINKRNREDKGLIMIQKIIQVILSIVVLMIPMSFIAGTYTAAKSGTINQSTKISTGQSGSYKRFSAQTSGQLSNTSNSSAKSKPVISQHQMTPITTATRAPKSQPRATQLADQNKGLASSSRQSTHDTQKTLPVSQKRAPAVPQEQHHDAPVVHGSSEGKGQLKKDTRGVTTESSTGKGKGQLKKDTRGVTTESSTGTGKPLSSTQKHLPTTSQEEHRDISPTHGNTQGQLHKEAHETTSGHEHHADTTEAHHDKSPTHGSTEGQQHKDAHGSISAPEHHADTTHDEKHAPSSGAHDMAKGILSSLAGAAVTATLNHFASRSSDASQATPQLVPQTPPDPNISLDDLVEKPSNETAAQPEQQQNQISDEEVIKEIKEEEDLEALEEQPGVEETGHQEEAEKSKGTVQEETDKDKNKVPEESTK
jgi:hypothetical protein